MGSGLSQEDLDEKNVVIIGGGFAGTQLASNLAKKGIPFVLIDPKDHFHYTIGALRAAVHPEFIKNILIDYRKTYGDHQFIQAKVTLVNFASKKVKLDNEEFVDFTECVFCVGSQGPFPGKLDDCVTSMSEATLRYEKFAEELDKAVNVLIVGGGAVGVELAGEIGEKYKAKNVILVHGSESLVGSNLGPSFQTRVRQGLEKFNVQLFLGDRVEDLNTLTLNTFAKQTVRTRNGEVIESDMVIKCTGLPPNTTITKDIFEESVFDSNHLIKVNEFFQVEGHEDIYAIGDCCNTAETKMALHAGKHADLLAKNFINELRFKDLVPYKPASPGLVVSIGKSSGAGIFNGWNVPSWMATILKSKNLFVSKFWSSMNQKMPSHEK